MGLGRGTSHGEGRGPESRLLGHGSLGTESQALGCPPPRSCRPFRLQEPGLCSVTVTTRRVASSRLLCMCACEYHVAVQMQTPARVRAPRVCASVCFKSPLGGNSPPPFLFGCDLGEIDSQPVRWMLTVPLIYRVTYAK